MKLLIAGLILAGLFGGPAMAADLRVKAPIYKAPPAAVPVSNWTGCYLGGNAGGGWNRIEATRITTSRGVPVNNDYGTDSNNGWLVGGQVGCDYQSGQFVFGIQGMFDATNINNSHTIPVLFAPPFTTFSYNTNSRSIFTVTGRLGMAVQPAMLLYLKGGGAWKREDLNVQGVVPFPFLSESASVTFSGWTIGGGIEYGFAPNWSVFAEADYLDFGTTSVTFIAAPHTVNAGQNGDTINQRQSVIDVLGGINWRFGPLFAKN